MLSAAVVVLAVGAGLAVVQPGDLGDDDDTEATAPDQETTTSTTAPDDTTTTTPGDTTTTTPGDTTTTTEGSGLGANGTGEVRGSDDGIAATGGESMIGAGLVLLVAGLVVRRSRPTTTT